MSAIEADDQFWHALDATNRAVESDGLYMTHLFVDEQVLLTRDWLRHMVPVKGGDCVCFARRRSI